MGRYALTRILWSIPTLLGMLTFVFLLFQIVPGDVVSAMLAQEGTSMTPEWAAQARKDLGLERPVWIQYLDWLGRFLRFDFGKSLWSGVPVLSAIALRLPITLQLVLMSVTISIVLGIPLGAAAALRQDTWVDYAARLFLIAGLSIPDFVFGLVLILALILTFSWFPPLEYANLFFAPFVVTQQLIFPSLVLGYRHTAVAARMMRSAMLEVINEDYIRTARAKGVTNRTVIFRHALRNALLPVITIYGVEMVLLFSGAIIIERVFVVPGIGTLMIEAMTVRDVPVVQGCVALVGVFVLFTNVLIDLSYAIIDPRIRYS